MVNHHKGAAVAPVLFIAGAPGDQIRGRSPKARQRSKREDQVGHPGELAGGNRAPSEGEMQCGDRAPADCLAMQQPGVAGGGLDGVAQGVAKVEQHPRALLALVFGDDGSLDGDRANDRSPERGSIAPEHGSRGAFEQNEEAPVADDRGRDALLGPGGGRAAADHFVADGAPSGCPVACLPGAGSE